jgi:hypothetical protein
VGLGVTPNKFNRLILQSKNLAVEVFGKPKTLLAEIIIGRFYRLDIRWIL